MVAGVVVARRGLHRGGLAGGGAPRQPRRFAGGAGAGHGALLAWPFCGIIGAPLGLKPLGGPSFDPALLPLEQAALYEASAAFLLNLAVLSLNHAERLVPLRRFYLLKAGLTAAVIRVMLQAHRPTGPAMSPRVRFRLRVLQLLCPVRAAGIVGAARLSGALRLLLGRLPRRRPRSGLRVRARHRAPPLRGRASGRGRCLRGAEAQAALTRGGVRRQSRAASARLRPPRGRSRTSGPLEASCFVFHPASG
ncbi:unnamed protein product [Prorocentrum cordatum]|uniref:Protein RFT1 homolog n=1 Tax=Prorocentrum cordatum TaxID=2364126 RepID=A0ABN9WDY1_9DINO|nr:unnamed protein product [Polarella glacialis]